MAGPVDLESIFCLAAAYLAMTSSRRPSLGFSFCFTEKPTAGFAGAGFGAAGVGSSGSALGRRVLGAARGLALGVRRGVLPALALPGMLS